ncbi:MAG: aspartate/glutamate racemase family protein [Pseudomonadota bacterium]
MKRVLVINPNTSASVTDMVLNSCRLTQPDVAWEGVTARFGAPYIASEAAYTLAAHAVLDAYAVHFAEHDAVLIACFGDPGMLALREICPVPVVSLAEASFKTAARRGRFAVVTGGKAWGPMLERFARTHQLDAQLVGIHTVELTGVQIAAAPERAMADLAAACQVGIDAGAQSIVLGGAALTGLTAALEKQLGMSVLDNVKLGAEAAAMAASGGEAPMSSAPLHLPGIKGVARELEALLA